MLKNLHENGAPSEWVGNNLRLHVTRSEFPLNKTSERVTPDLCLLPPSLGAGHDCSMILGKLRNTRLDCFSQELRELMVELNFFNKNLLFVPI